MIMNRLRTQRKWSCSILLKIKQKIVNFKPIKIMHKMEAFIIKKRDDKLA